MKIIWKYLKDYRSECVITPLFKMLEALFELLVPIVISLIVDQGIADHNTGYIMQMSGLLLALAVIGFTCSITAQYYAAKAAVGCATGMRHSLFAHIQSLSFTEMDTVGTSTLITRMTSDINQVQNGVNLVLRLFLRSPFIVIGAMVMAFTIDWKAALVFVVTIPVLAAVVFGIMLSTRPLYRKVQAGLDQVLQITRENLTGVRVLRAFQKEQSEIERFQRANEELNHRQKFVGKISGLMNPLTYLIVNMAIVAVIYVGAIRVQSGALTQGQVIALYNYMSQILVELIKLANLVISISKSLACAKRIETIFDLSCGMKDGTIENALANEDASEIENAPSDVQRKEADRARQNPIAIEFQHVSLQYQGAGEESLTDLSFQIKRGQTIGIIGGTGSGKTSLVHLIPRFYDATKGQIKINGIDVKDYKIAALRKKVAIVMQRTMLFHGNIRDNICWGKKDATEEQIWKAVQISQAEEFVEAKEHQLDYVIEQNGRNLSGGQQQRLSIARAVVRRPEILILDDSASALDYATDAALRKAIRQLDQDTTVLIVSQRTASLMHADQIIVLDDGRVARMGTHEELLQTSSVYREIYESQFGKEA